jgi:hypothetical protein
MSLAPVQADPATTTINVSWDAGTPANNGSIDYEVELYNSSNTAKQYIDTKATLSKNTFTK